MPFEHRWTGEIRAERVLQVISGEKEEYKPTDCGPNIRALMNEWSMDATKVCRASHEHDSV